MFNKRILPVCLALLFSCALACEGNITKAPDFTLQSIDGKTVSLSGFKGKTVFLDFWATWCPPCKVSMPAVKALQERYAGKDDIVIIGINVGESKETVKNFAAQNNINYITLLSDNSVIAKYSINSIPRFIIIDKDGNIVKSFTGFTNGLENEWKRILDNRE